MFVRRRKIRVIKIFFTIFFVIILSCHPLHITIDELFGDTSSISLLNSDTIKLWQQTPFDYSGETVMADSTIILHRGGYLTGVSWKGPVLYMNYELELDARRIEGHDFFCGITFPFEETYASLILGGWGGYTTGISSINGIDASENGTAFSILFENNIWYHVKMRITPDHIEAWVDDHNIISLETTGKTISLRSDVDISTPLSFMSYNTTGEIKNIVLKKL